MEVSFASRNYRILDEGGLTPMFATVLLISVTIVFAGVLAVSVSQLTASTPAPSLSLTLDKQASQSNKTVYGVFHAGGDDLIGEDVYILFEGYMGGRDNPSAEFVVGSIVSLDATPEIVWYSDEPSASLTVTSESMGFLEPGELWVLEFTAGNAANALDVTRIAVVHTSSNTLIFASSYIEGL